jgi:hypothetical protein
MTSALERLVRIRTLAEMRRDLVVIMIIQTRLGRLALAVLEGTVARG